MRHVLIPLLCALAIFSATAGTALMATVTVDPVCGGMNGQVSIGYTYDDQSNIVQTVILHNDSGGSASIIAQVFDTNGNLLRTFNNNIGANTPLVVFNISSIDLHMVSVTGAHGTSLQLPVRLACTITPGR